MTLSRKCTVEAIPLALLLIVAVGGVAVSMREMRENSRLEREAERREAKLAGCQAQLQDTRKWAVELWGSLQTAEAQRMHQFWQRVQHRCPPQLEAEFQRITSRCDHRVQALRTTYEEKLPITDRATEALKAAMEDAELRFDRNPNWFAHPDVRPEALVALRAFVEEWQARDRVRLYTISCRADMESAVEHTDAWRDYAEIHRTIGADRGFLHERVFKDELFNRLTWDLYQEVIKHEFEQEDEE